MDPTRKKDLYIARRRKILMENILNKAHFKNLNLLGMCDTIYFMDGYMKDDKNCSNEITSSLDRGYCA